MGDGLSGHVITQGRLTKARDEYKQRAQNQRPKWLQNHRLWDDASTLWEHEERMLEEFPTILQNENCIPNRDLLWCMVKWKYPGTWEKYAQKNSQEKIKNISHSAFSDFTNGTGNKMGKLKQLDGIGQPMASVLLTFWQPDTYTIIDRRALQALTEHDIWMGSLNSNNANYLEYLEKCRSFSKRAKMSLRDIDRALWILGGE